MTQNDRPMMNEVERIRKETHAAICKEWEDTAPQAVKDGVPPTRILAAIAARRGMTSQGVENVLRNAGLYDGARKYKETVSQEES